MKKTRRIPLRIVFYREDGKWVGHCLEFDLMGDGDTIQEACGLLAEAIFIQVEASFKFDNPANLFSPAEGKFFQMFAEGKDIAHAELNLESNQRIESDDIVIEHTEYRQYDGGGMVPA